MENGINQLHKGSGPCKMPSLVSLYTWSRGMAANLLHVISVTIMNTLPHSYVWANYYIYSYGTFTLRVVQPFRIKAKTYFRAVRAQIPQLSTALEMKQVFSRVGATVAVQSWKKRHKCFDGWSVSNCLIDTSWWSKIPFCLLVRSAAQPFYY